MLIIGAAFFLFIYWACMQNAQANSGNTDEARFLFGAGGMVAFVLAVGLFIATFL